jgi:hypothetical protein
MHEQEIHAKSFRFLYANYSKALETGLSTGSWGRGREQRKKWETSPAKFCANLCSQRLDQRGSGNKNISEAKNAFRETAHSKSRETGARAEEKLVIN